MFTQPNKLFTGHHPKLISPFQQKWHADRVKLQQIREDCGYKLRLTVRIGLNAINQPYLVFNGCPNDPGHLFTFSYTAICSNIRNRELQHQKFNRWEMNQWDTHENNLLRKAALKHIICCTITVPIITSQLNRLQMQINLVASDGQFACSQLANILYNKLTTVYEILGSVISMLLLLIRINSSHCYRKCMMNQTSGANNDLIGPVTPFLPQKTRSFLDLISLFSGND